MCDRLGCGHINPMSNATNEYRPDDLTHYMARVSELRAEVAALRRALECYRRDHEVTRRSRTCACECCVAAVAALATRGGDASG